MPRFRFSMWWLMVAITVLCVLLFFGVTVGNFVEIAFASFFWCVVPTPLVMLAIYSRGDAQAFAIGALVPWVTLVVFQAPALTSFLFAMLWLPSMSATCGVLAALTRRWIEANLPR